VDVSARDSVRSLADAAAALGDVVQLVQAAGLSPAMAPPEAILKVDLYGTALVFEEFGRVIAPVASAIVISSMAGYRQPALEPEREQQLATAPIEELLQLPFLSPEHIPNSVRAYEFSKRANHDAARTDRAGLGARHGVPRHPGLVSCPSCWDCRRGPTTC
jgi:NAD(P)-dependent dehydrogenase (short-subunit alcohol dehydrogenase family)